MLGMPDNAQGLGLDWSGTASHEWSVPGLERFARPTLVALGIGVSKRVNVAPAR
jgi:hypothetical protein